MSPSSNVPFPPTRWSMVLAARNGGDARQGRRALEDLCRLYWQPVYGFARRRGHPPADAEDLAQGFFARLLEEDLFAKADASAGRLRSFLLGAFQRHQREEWRKATAAKRGGGHGVISIDADESEAAFQAEDTSVLTPEAAYEKQCALALLADAMGRLAKEQAAAGRAQAFELLRPLLSPDGGADEAQSHLRIAAALGQTVEASRAAVYRLRKRFREVLRDAVADTLEEPTDQAVDEELLALRSALSA
ncbi:MAG: RNA polymerase sigma factor [Prosthecobacter sp.]